MSSHALLEAVVASLWLGALLAPAALLMTHALPRLVARQRYVLWWVVLLAIVLAPLGKGRRADGPTDGTATGGRADGLTGGK